MDIALFDCLASYSIAAGFACGVAVLLTPLIGFHFVGAAFFAWLIEVI